MNNKSHDKVVSLTEIQGDGIVCESIYVCHVDLLLENAESQTNPLTIPVAIP